MRLRTYRHPEDDQRLIELAAQPSSCATPLGIADKDFELLKRNSAAEELASIGHDDTERTVIVALAQAQDKFDLTSKDKPEDSQHAALGLPKLKPLTEGTIIGFIELRIQANTLSARPEGSVHILCVDSRADRFAVSDALLKEAQIWAKRNGLFRLSLEALAGDEDAISYYERSGFHISSVSMEMSCSAVDSTD